MPCGSTGRPGPTSGCSTPRRRPPPRGPRPGAGIDLHRRRRPGDLRRPGGPATTSAVKRRSVLAGGTVALGLLFACGGDGGTPDADPPAVTGTVTTTTVAGPPASGAP